MFLGIFSGIEVLFFLLGVMSVISAQLIWRFKCTHQPAMSALILIATGAATIIFAVAWSVSSVLEGEPQAGSMGVVIIMLPGLIMTVLGWRLTVKRASLAAEQ